MQGLFLTYSCRRFDNTLHSLFQKVMYNYITSGIVPIQMLHIKQECITEWGEGVALEVELNAKVRRQIETVQLDKLRTERLWYINLIFNHVKMARKSPEAPLREAGEMLSTVLAAYHDIRRLSQNKITGKVLGLLVDLAKAKVTPALVTLELADEVAKLQQINDAILATDSDRSTERATDMLPPCKRVREANDRCWLEVLHRIESSYILCESAEDRAQIAVLVNGINQRIKEYSGYYNMGKGQRSGAGSGDAATTLPDALPTNSGTDTTPGADADTGNSGSDTGSGDSGSDTGSGDGGSDTGSGDSGNDTGSGDSGSDTGSGDSGNDTGSGDSGSDTGSDDSGSDSGSGGSGGHYDDDEIVG